MSRRKIIISSIIVLAVVLVLATRDERVQRGNSHYFVVEKLDAGEGRTVLILLADEWFEIPSWYYEIHVNGQIVVPTTHLWQCCGDDTNFQILSSRDNTVIGVVRPSHSGVLHVLHDFSCGHAWPRQQDHDSYTSSWARGKELRDILQVDHPEMKLFLPGEELQQPLIQNEPVRRPD
jgi:hypothetical protein